MSELQFHTVFSLSVYFILLYYILLYCVLFYYYSLETCLCSNDRENGSRQRCGEQQHRMAGEDKQHIISEKKCKND